MEEVIERQLFGTGKPHPLFRSMLGDYLALATGPKTLWFKKPPEKWWVSMHASVTEDEVLVPLILFDCGKKA